MSEETQNEATPKGIPTLDELRQFIAGGAQPTTSVSERTVSDYAALDTAQALDRHVITHPGRVVNRVGPRGKLIPFHVSSIDLVTVVIKSREQGSLGQPAIGKNLEVLGFDVQTDDTGKPRFEKVPNPEFGKVEGAPEHIHGAPLLITENAQHEKLEPHRGMYFKAFYGRDTGRAPHSTRRNVNSFIMLAGDGVPTKARKSKKSGNTYFVPDWEEMPNFEHELMKPILNAELAQDQGILNWISSYGGIPQTSNAFKEGEEDESGKFEPPAPEAGAENVGQDGNVFEAGSTGLETPPAEG
jgi:hypothetical protein